MECGYWHLYRFDPRLAEAGKNPFQLDSKQPDLSKFRDFLLSEVRYNSLQRQDAALAEQLFAKTEQDAAARYQSYLRMARD